jgi:hypothetical protein
MQAGPQVAPTHVTSCCSLLVRLTSRKYSRVASAVTLHTQLWQGDGVVTEPLLPPFLPYPLFLRLIHQTLVMSVYVLRMPNLRQTRDSTEKQDLQPRGLLQGCLARYN